MTPIEVLGYLTAIYITFKFFQLVGALFWRPVNPAKLGQWAVVTGATDGIGKAYVRELASLGMDIVLISRNPEKLGRTAGEIESEFKVKTICIPVDFTQDAAEYVPRVEKEIHNLEIGLLVNNVGLLMPGMREFLEIQGGMKMIQDMVNVNIVSMNEMTRIVLPKMVSRKRGAVILVSSLATEVNIRSYHIYSSTKAYVNKLFEGLEIEYSKYGIIFQLLQPGPVYSNMTKQLGREGTSFQAPSTEEFAKAALNRLGIYNITPGCWAHSFLNFQVKVLRCLPSTMAENILEKDHQKSVKNLEQKGLR